MGHPPTIGTNLDPRPRSSMTRIDWFVLEVSIDILIVMAIVTLSSRRR